MTLKSALLASVLMLAALAPGLAQAQTPMPDPLDDRSVKRLERMEKVVRELRSIVFQGRDTSKPVVVQPAETEAQLAELADKVSDLQQTLTRLNGANETLTLELDQARRAADSQKMRGDALESRLSALETRIAAIESAQTAAILTPPDVISQASLAIPLMILYEGSILAVVMVEKRVAAAAKATAATPPATPPPPEANPAE